MYIKSFHFYWICCFCGASIIGAFADWPAYRGSNARQSWSADFLPGQSSSSHLTFSHLWSFLPPQPPAPAWGAPAPRSYWQRLESIEPRVTDDRRFALVADASSVYFGSSSDDQLRALDLQTGKLKWTFSANGPIRYAPALASVNVDSAHPGSAHPRILFSSDDGFIYCLNADSGALIWRQNIGGSDRRVVGNGRVISEYPSRTGVLVQGANVYVGAGLYPQQGCFLSAFRVADGSLVWRKQVEDSLQGYLLAGEDQIIAPTGRGNPVAFRIIDGELMHRYSGVGGTYAVLTDDELVAGTGNDGSLAVSDQDTRQRLAQIAGSHLVVGPRLSIMAGKSGIQALDRIRYMQLNRRLLQLQAQSRELKKSLEVAVQAKDAELARTHLEALEQSSTELNAVESQLPECVIWKNSDLTGVTSMVGSEVALIVCEPNLIRILNPETGAVSGRIPTLDAVVDLAITEKEILLSLSSGEIQCWSLNHQVSAKKIAHADSAPDERQNDQFGKINQNDFVSQTIQKAQKANVVLSYGYGLFEFQNPVTENQRQLAENLVKSTQLQWVWIAPDNEGLEEWRNDWIHRGQYGTRVHILSADSVSPETFTPYLFNWIWIATERWNRSSPALKENWKSISRPYGGEIWGWGDDQTPIETHYRREQLEGSGAWTHQYADSGNTADAGDQLIRPPFKIQWFGGPGADRMVDRHLRGPGPLALEGRLIIPGENQFIAVDAYNGAALWRREFPGSQRYTLPFDAPYYGISQQGFFLANTRHLNWIDPSTGKELASWDPPLEIEEQKQLQPGIESSGEENPGPDHDDFAIHWGYVAPIEGAVIASLQWGNASRTQPSRELINVDYSNHQPIVTSQAVLRWNPETETRDWIYAGGRLLNTTFTAGSDQVTFLESRSEAAMQSKEGRLPLKQFNSEDLTQWVHLDSLTGQELWRRSMGSFMAAADNVIYLTRSGSTLVATGSLLNSKASDTEYRIEAISAANGETLWQRSHLEGKPGAYSHGEQNHHPVILKSAGWVIAEPYAYRLEDGEVLTVDPAGQEKWKLVRPGHSCGTITAGAECLFFRANNPTSLDMRTAFQFAEQKRLDPKRVDQAADWEFEKLAPTRPGCWINIIPAGGLALIPEASSGCVCHYSLQTSMAFLPVGQ